MDLRNDAANARLDVAQEARRGRGGRGRADARGAQRPRQRTGGRGARGPRRRRGTDPDAHTGGVRNDVANARMDAEREVRGSGAAADPDARTIGARNDLATAQLDAKRELRTARSGPEVDVAPPPEVDAARARFADVQAVGDRAAEAHSGAMEQLDAQVEAGVAAADPETAVAAAGDEVVAGTTGVVATDAEVAVEGLVGVDLDDD